MIRVLVVDDEPLARRGVRVCLRRAHDVEIVGEADSGETALERIAALRPDLLFLDVQMPGMDGFALLERVRADPAAPPVILMTAFVDDHVRLRALRGGAACFLPKPVDAEQLAECVRLACAGPH